MSYERVNKFFGDMIPPARIKKILAPPTKREINDVCDEILEEYQLKGKRLAVRGEGCIRE